MKVTYVAMAVFLALFVFQSAPALGGEGKEATQTYPSSKEGFSANWERPTAPFSFSPAPHPRHRGHAAPRQTRLEAPHASFARPSPDGRIAVRRDGLTAPLSFSPALRSRPERVNTTERGPEVPSRLAERERVRYEPVRADMEKTVAPLGFFPVRDRECLYRSC